jgi:hypothetical protein
VKGGSSTGKHYNYQQRYPGYHREKNKSKLIANKYSEGNYGFWIEETNSS